MLCEIYMFSSTCSVWFSTVQLLWMQGVLERFSQIQPSLIFSVNAVTYNGRIHPHMEKLQQVVEGMMLPDLVASLLSILTHSRQSLEVMSFYLCTCVQNCVT